jgi:hypothetical protein
MQPMIYYVWGGIFEDTTFRSLTPGTEESYGPFHDEATADRIWRAQTSRNVDIAQHRLFVLSIPQPS